MIEFLPIEPTIENAHFIWQRLQAVKEFALDDTSDFATLAAGLANQNSKYFYIADSGSIVGYCCMSNIVPGREAQWHTLLFDRKMLGRGERINKLIARLMDVNQLKIVRVVVPSTHRGTCLMLDRMGWSKDGTLRQFIYRNGEPVDGVMYSVTPEEVKRGRPIRQRQAEEQDEDASGPAYNSNPTVVVTAPDDAHGTGRRETTTLWAIPRNVARHIAGWIRAPRHSTSTNQPAHDRALP